MNGLKKIIEENKKADDIETITIRRYTKLIEQLDTIKLTKENYERIKDFIGGL